MNQDSGTLLVDSLIGIPGEAYRLFPFALPCVNEPFLHPGNATRAQSRALFFEPAQTGNHFW